MSIASAESSARADRVVMHIDFDYFFAQCEELRNPDLKKEPVVVCAYSGRTETSGVVSTSNYVARKFGVKSGIPIATAVASLSDVGIKGIFLPIDRLFYSKISSAAMAIIQSNADIFEQRGIDECYLDVSRKVGFDFDAATLLASSIKSDILKKVGLTCSVGVAPNKLIAKIASDFKKPDGLMVVRTSEILELISPLDIKVLPGVGSKTSEVLKSKMSVKTVADLRKLSSFELIGTFGNKVGTNLFRAALGMDDEPVIQSTGEAAQLSRIVTLKRDSDSEAEMRQPLDKVCGELFQMTTKQNVSFKTITVQLILSNLRTLSHSRTLKTYSSNPDELISVARQLLHEMLNQGLERKVRRVGVRLSELQDVSGQNSLLDYVE